MQNKLFISLVVLILLLGGFGYSTWQNNQTGPLETTKVKIADLPVVHGLPLYLAIEKGYFAEEGISVELVKFEAPNQIVDAIMLGQVDFTSPSGAMGITGIADLKNPGKVKIYIVSGGDDIVPSEAILVRNDSSISSIQGLKGKRLGILPGIQWRTIARHVLAQNNLVVEQDVMLVELAPGLQAPALDSGQIDALFAIEPMPTIVKSKNIGKEIVSGPTLTTIGNPFYGGAGAVNLEFATDNPNTTKKVLEIFARAVDEVNSNPEVARQYLKGYTPLGNDLIVEVPIIKFKMVEDLTLSEINAVQKFYDIFSTYGVVDKPMSFRSIIYNR